MNLPSTARGLFALVVLAGFLFDPRATEAQEVALQLRTKDHRVVFHLGEPILLELVFTSSNKKAVVAAGYDHPFNPRPLDEFLISPNEGWRDPYQDYHRAHFNSPLGLFGGQIGYPGNDPVVLNVSLNDWVRFTKPGQYELKVKDQRVMAEQRPGANFEYLDVFSNTLSLTILPSDKDWQAAQLATALAFLKKHQDLNNGIAPCQALSSLGTLDSEVAIIDSLTDQDPYSRCGGLPDSLAMQNRKLLLARMQKKLDDPHAALSSNFIEVMAGLTALEEGDSDFSQRESEIRTQLYDHIFSSLEEKQGTARAAALSTLVMGSISTDLSANSPTFLRLALENFEQLGQSAQSTLLSAKWPQIAGPALIPVLKRCATRENDRRGCGGLPGDLLLARLKELSPSDAREIILADALSENPHFPVQTLASLPDKELPELDLVLAQRLESNENAPSTAALIQRYATSGLEGAVFSYLHKNESAVHGTDVQSHLLAYLLRVDPDAGAEALRSALSLADENLRLPYLLNQVASFVPSPRIQPIAIAALADRYDVAANAADALALVGDEQAKAALLQRLEQWHAKWQGRGEELDWRANAGLPQDDRFLGDSLIQSLAGASGWLLTSRDLSLLRAAAVTENQKQRVDGYVQRSGNKPVPITLINFGTPNIHLAVAQYNFDNLDRALIKLQQFPAGTVFHIVSSAAETPGLQETRGQIESFITEHNFRLDTADERSNR